MRLAFSIIAFGLIMCAGIDLAGSAEERKDKDETFELEILSVSPDDFVKDRHHIGVERPYMGASYLRLIGLSETELNNIFGTKSPKANRQKDKLLSDEFYTQLKLRTRFNDDIVFGVCGPKGPSNWYLTVKLSASYKGRASALPISILKDQLILVGANDRKTTCTLTDLDPPDQEIHNLLYTGFPSAQGEYNLTFNVSQGETTNSSAFELVVQLAKFALTLVPQFPVPVGAPVEAQNIAKQIDTRRNSTFSVTSQYSATLTAVRSAGPNQKTKASRLKLTRDGKPSDNPGQLIPAVGNYLSITSPLIERIYEKEKGDFGMMEIYSSRTASLLLDSIVEPTSDSTDAPRLVKPDNLLTDSAIGTSRYCFPGTGGCKTKDNMTFEETLKLEKIILEDILAGKIEDNRVTPESAENTGKEEPSGRSTPTRQSNQVADPKTIERNVHLGCGKIKKITRTLGLSPIDALLIRWALLAQPGVDLISTFPTTSGAHDVCWSPDDKQRMLAIGTAMNVTFEGLAPTAP